MNEEVKWFPLSKAHLFFPLDVTAWTIRNWVRRGVLSRSTGKRVFLRTRQRGGRVETCMDYYAQFDRELNGETGD